MGIFSGGITTWIMVAIVVVVIGISIFSMIQKRKQEKIEKKRRQKEVRDKIKVYLRDNYQVAHKRVEYENVVGRTGPEYRYRDVFDVVVTLYDSKTNELFKKMAFEVEGKTQQISRKEYLTTWHVNDEIDLSTTIERIEKTMLKQKSYWKMSKAEREEYKRNREAEKKAYREQKKAIKEARSNKATTAKVKTKVNEDDLLIKKQPNEKFGATKK